MTEITDTVFVNTERAFVKPFACDDHEREAWLRALADGSLPRIAFSGPCIVTLPFLMVGRVRDAAYLTVMPYVPLEETLLADLGEVGTLQVSLFVPVDDCRPVDNENE